MSNTGRAAGNVGDGVTNTPVSYTRRDKALLKELKKALAMFPPADEQLHDLKRRLMLPRVEPRHVRTILNEADAVFTRDLWPNDPLMVTVRFSSRAVAEEFSEAVFRLITRKD